MNFDTFFSNTIPYFGKHSDGLENCLKKYYVHKGIAVDIGAGEGRNTIYLSSMGFSVIAIEPSKSGCARIIEESSQLGYDIQVINEEFLECSTQIKNTQLVVSLTSLDHMDPKDYAKTISEMKRILVPGGLIYIVVFTEDDPGYKKDLINASECSRFITHYFRHNELKDYFSDFEILEYNEYIKEDTSHGPKHYHGKAKLIARKP